MTGGFAGGLAPGGLLPSGPSNLGPQSSYQQFPRFNLYLNGNIWPKPVSVEISSNNYSHASRFEAIITCTPTDADNFSNTASIPFQVGVTTQGGTDTILLAGLVDNIDYDMIMGHMTLTGRDFAGALIDSPTQDTFSNLTSSQVAAQIVANHADIGLTGNITPTTTLVGRYYGIDYGFTVFGQFYRATNEWDLLLFLAQQEGFDLRVQGNVLYFGPPTDINSSTPYVINIIPGPPVSCSVEKLTAVRSLTLAKDVQVTVISWNSLLARPIKVTVKSQQQGAPSGGFGPVQTYVFNKPDLTPDQALKYAQSRLMDITKRERIIEVTMPGELTIMPDSVVQLVGSLTSWDQTYYIDEITRNISFEGGFTQSLRLKNVSPNTQVSVT